MSKDLILRQMQGKPTNIRMDDMSLVTFNVILPHDLLQNESGVLNQTELRYKFISYRLPPFYDD